MCVCVELEAAFLNEFQKYTCSLEKEKKDFMHHVSDALGNSMTNIHPLFS